MRAVAAAGLLGLALLLAACGEEEEWTSEDADVVDDRTAAADPTPEPTLEPTPADVADEQTGVEPLIDMSRDRDPRDILIEMAIDSDDPNYELIYSVLPERFQVLEFNERWIRSIANSLPSGDVVSRTEDFLIQEFDDYVVLQHAEFPLPHRFVFTREGDEWRFDPGDQSLISTALRIEHPDGGAGFGIGPDDGLRTEWDTDFEPSTPPIVSVSPMAIGSTTADVTVVTQFQVSPGREAPGELFDSHLLEDVTIPFDRMTWSAGGETGDVEITWTNAAMDHEHFILPGWAEHELEFIEELAEEESPRVGPRHFSATFVLTGVPEDADEVTFEINDVEVGPFGDDVSVSEGEFATWNFTITFPNETTHPILIGEAPEPATVDVPSKPPEIIHEEDLPPVTEFAEFLEFSGVSYSETSEGVEATVEFDLDDRTVEFAGPTHLIWDDGVETEGSARVSQFAIKVSSERSKEPHDAEISAVRFEQLVWDIGDDENAVMTDSAIETEWGDFQIIRIVDGQIDYQPAGQRYLRNLEIEHPDKIISIRGSSASFDEGFRPQRSSMSSTANIRELIRDAPLPASATVWKAEPEVVIDLH